jgi:Amt family ammonium transporter
VFAIITIDKMKIDDPVGAISVHGVVGFWGLMAVPLTNSETSFMGQLAGAATIFVWVFSASLVTWFVIKMIMGIRVSEEEASELRGAQPPAGLRYCVGRRKNASFR